MTSTTYRVYQTIRNAAGGLDSLQAGSEHIQAATAQDAADQYADQLRETDECDGVTVVATDDAGDSATADV
jgi:hypothetical protein